MRKREHIKQGLRAFQPKKFRQLTAQPYKQIIGTVATWLGLALVIMLLVSIPKFLSIQKDLETKLQSFETFDLDTNISLSTPISIFETPSIIINPEQKMRLRKKSSSITKAYTIKKLFGKEKQLFPGTPYYIFKNMQTRMPNG